MPRFRAAFGPFHASCRIASPFERVNFRHAVRHFRRRAANWSFLGLPALVTMHRVVTSRNHLSPCRAYSLLQRPCRPNQINPINESARLEMDSKSLPAESSPDPVGAPFFAAPTLIDCLVPFSKLNSMHWWSCQVTTSRTHQSPIFEARRGAAIVRSVIEPPPPPPPPPPATRLNGNSLP